jgi:hypothetical protein
MNTGTHPIHGHYTGGGWLTFGIAVLIAVPAFWAFLNAWTPGNDHELMLDDDSFLLLRLLQMSGLVLGLAPIIGYDGGLWHHVLWTIGDTVGVIGLLVIATPGINWLIARGRSGLYAPQESRTPVALVMGLLYAGFGFIISSILPGPGWTAHDVVTTLVFSALALACIVLIYWFVTSFKVFTDYVEETPEQAAHSVGNYRTIERVYNGTTITLINTGRKVSLGDLVLRSEWPAAVMAAGIVLTLSVVTRSAVAGEFTTWSDSIATFALAALTMLVAAAVGLFLVDWSVYRTETVKSTVEKALFRPALAFSFTMVWMAIFASQLAR